MAAEKDNIQSSSGGVMSPLLSGSLPASVNTELEAIEIQIQKVESRLIICIWAGMILGLLSLALGTGTPLLLVGWIGAFALIVLAMLYHFRLGQLREQESDAQGT